jgi:hypothetical protein
MVGSIMKNLYLAVLTGMLLIPTNLQSQVGVTAYSIYALGINTGQNHRISGEFKLFANRSYDELLTELDGFYNFRAREYHRFSVGLGLNIGPFKDYDNIYAITIPASIEIYPLKELKKVSLLFELAPEIRPEEDLNIRFLWGIRYSFGKQK